MAASAAASSGAATPPSHRQASHTASIGLQSRAHPPTMHNRMLSIASHHTRNSSSNSIAPSVDTTLTTPQWSKLPVQQWSHTIDSYQHQMEDKKEELRQLVGKRYKILIDTADEIEGMQKQVESVYSNVQECQSNIQQLQHYVQSSAPDSYSQQLQTTSQDSIQLLTQYLGAYSDMWACVDAQQYVNGIERYIKAQHTGTQLLTVLQSGLATQADTLPQLKQSNSTNDSNSTQLTSTHVLTLLAQYSTSLQQLPATISSICSRQLSHSRSLAVTSDALTALVLLSPSTNQNKLQTVLQSFLHAQLRCIQHTLWSANKALSLLASKQAANADSKTAIVAHALTKISTITIQTFLFGRYLFGSKPTKDVDAYYAVNVVSRLQQFTDRQRQLQTASASDTNRQLPQIPQLADNSIVKLFSQWFADVCAQLTQSHNVADTDQATPSAVAALLNHITTTAALTETRELLLRTLGFDSDSSLLRTTPDAATAHNAPASHLQTPKTARERYLQFDDAVRVLLGSTIKSKLTSATLWDDILLQPLVSRSKQLIDICFEHVDVVVAIDDATKALRRKHKRKQRSRQSQHRLNGSVSPSAVSSSDSESESAGSRSGKKAGHKQRSPLAAASDATVHHIISTYKRQTRQLNDNLAVLFASDYLHSSHSSTRTPSPSSTAAYRFTYLEHAHSSELLPHIQRMHTQTVQQLVDTLKKRLSDVEYALLEMTDHHSNVQSTSDDGGDNAALLVEQSVLVGRVCYDLAQLSTQSADGKEKSTRQRSLLHTSTSLVHDSLLSTARSAFRIWSKHVATALATSFGRQLQDRCNNTSVSPAQTSSPYVYDLLLSVTHRLYAAQGHDVQVDVLQWLTSDITVAILQLYERYSQQSVLSAQDAFDMVVTLSLLPLPAQPATHRTTLSNLLQRIMQPQLQSLEDGQQHWRNELHLVLTKDRLLFDVLLRHPAAEQLLKSMPSKSPNRKDRTTGENGTAQDGRQFLPIATAASRIPTISTSLYPTKAGFRPVSATQQAAYTAQAKSTAAAQPLSASTHTPATSHMTPVAIARNTAANGLQSPAFASPLSAQSTNANVAIGLNLLNQYAGAEASVQAQRAVAQAAQAAESARETGRELLGKGRNLLGNVNANFANKWFQQQ